MDANNKQNSIARVQAMLIDGGDGEMSELTREDLDEIRREVGAKLREQTFDEQRSLGGRSGPHQPGA